MATKSIPLRFIFRSPPMSAMLTTLERKGLWERDGLRVRAGEGLQAATQRRGGVGVPLRTPGLTARLAVPVEAQPNHAVENGGERFGGGTFAVGILDT